MNTPSHLIINAAIEKKFGAKFNLAKSAFLWGAVLPDLPFALLTLGAYVYYQFVLQQHISGVMENVVHVSYFNDPWWIAAHNFQHSPTALTLYIIMLWRFVGKIGTRGHWWLSYVFGNMVHSAIDVLTHTVRPQRFRTQSNGGFSAFWLDYTPTLCRCCWRRSARVCSLSSFLFLSTSLSLPK